MERGSCGTAIGSSSTFKLRQYPIARERRGLKGREPVDAGDLARARGDDLRYLDDREGGKSGDPLRSRLLGCEYQPDQLDDAHAVITFRRIGHPHDNEMAGRNDRDPLPAMAERRKAADLRRQDPPEIAIPERANVGVRIGAGRFLDPR